MSLAMSTVEELVQEQHRRQSVENDKEPEEKTIILFAGFSRGLRGLLHSHLLANDVLHVGKDIRQTQVEARDQSLPGRLPTHWEEKDYKSEDVFRV